MSNPTWQTQPRSHRGERRGQFSLRQSSPDENIYGDIFITIARWEYLNWGRFSSKLTPVQPVKMQPCLTPTTSASFLQKILESRFQFKHKMFENCWTCTCSLTTNRESAFVSRVEWSASKNQQHSWSCVRLSKCCKALEINIAPLSDSATQVSSKN